MNSKGISVYISWVIILVVVVIGIGLVLSSGIPIIEESKDVVSLSEAEQFFTQLDSSITEVSQEGIGSSRLLRVPSGDYTLIDRGVEFRALGSSFEPLSRRFIGNFAIFGGSDVTCAEEAFEGTSAYRLENTFLRAYLKVASGTVDTAENIMSIRSKAGNFTITPTDSSIMIDSNPATSSGDGFSELTRQGSGLPQCRVHYEVNSTTVSYDIFYTLHSGADFIQVEVRNIES